MWAQLSKFEILTSFDQLDFTSLFHSFRSLMIVNRNKGVKGHTNFGNHIETRSSNRFDTTNKFRM